MSAVSLTYAPFGSTYSGGLDRTRTREALNRKARREYARLIKGMEGYDCWWFDLTAPRGVGVLLRESAWHILLTRIRQRKGWEDAQAWTVYEWKERRSIYLHVVIKNTAGITASWLSDIVELLQDGTQIGGFDHIYDAPGAAHYLTKQLSDEAVALAWPRGFRVATVTRKWCPEWLSRKEWQ
jgi:hypothetical protein